MSTCPFCAKLCEAHERLPANAHTAAIPDAFPISPGHTLIVTRRHVARYLDLSPGERAALWELVPEVLARLEEHHRPAGFNLRLNDGAAAGQTVPHVHLRVIPRYEGDVPDPRGGVRWIIAEKAPYWSREGHA